MCVTRNPDVASSMRMMAVCITGQPRGVLDFTAASLARNLLLCAPFIPEIFVVSSAALDHTFESLLPGVFTRVTRMRDPPATVMRHFVKGVGRINHRGVPWMGAKGYGHHAIWSWLAQINATSVCLNHIEQREREMGRRYAAVSRVRMDARVFDPFPQEAWAALRSGVAVLQKGQSFGGLNDRFVLAPRDDFSKYARLYRDMSVGTGRWARFPGPFNAELALKWQLEWNGVQHRALQLPICLVARRENATHVCGKCKNAAEIAQWRWRATALSPERCLLLHP